jgi:glycosyltransferase involved in cell wall biosynthesis
VQFDADNIDIMSARADAPVASFAGFLNQADISRAYVAADCLVLPSDYGETWGLVVNEAMASGLPCIVSRACGCAEDLVELDWTFPPGDIAALADRITAMKTSHAPPQLRPLPSIADTVATLSLAYRAMSARAPTACSDP